MWTYSEPFDEVGGIEGYVCFYQERVRIELEDRWDRRRTRRGTGREPVPRVG